MKPSLVRGLLLAWMAASCGGTPMAAPAPAAAPLPLGPATVAPMASAPKAEAGSRAPEQLQLLLRVSDPEQLARELLAFLPAVQPRQIVQSLVGEQLAEVVDITQELDLASVGHGAAIVVSFAVRPEAEPRLGEGRVLREGGGLAHIGRPDDGAPHPGTLASCAFAASAGRVSTRLVCASDDATLEATALYLARTVPTEPFDAEARVTIPGRTLREKQRGVGKAIDDAASAKLGTALVERFVEEIDRLDIDLRLTATQLEPSFDLRLTGRESMVARVVVPQTKPAPPPRAFYRLPLDALVALHTVGAQPDDIRPLRTALAETLESGLVLDGYASDRSRAIRQQIEGLFLTGGSLVLALGVSGGRAGAEKALDALDAAKGKPADEKQAEARVRAAIVPWMLAEVEEPAERWTKGLRDLVQRAEEAERTRTPGSKSSTPRDPDGSHVDVRVGTLDPKWGLPKDAVHLEVLIAPRTKGQRPTRTGHLFAAPKGVTTWVGYSEDIAAITSRLRTALDDAAVAGTLARSTEALALQKESAVAAGFGSLAGLALFTATTATAADLRALAEASARTGHVGAPGSELVTWSITADPAPGGPHVTLRLPLSRPAAENLVRLLRL